MNPGFEAEWRARFDRFAARGGSEAQISGWSEHGMSRRIEAVMRAIDAFGPPPGRPFLDLGCGSGAYCLHLRERGFRTFGADYSPGMLGRALAVTRCVDGLAPIPLVAADILHLPFADARFDGLINVGVMQHIARADQALGEIGRICAAGALAYVDTLNARSLQAFVLACAAYPRAWLKGRLRPRLHAIRRSAASLAALGAAAGFDTVEVRGIYVLPRPLRFLESLFDRLDRLRLPGSRTSLVHFMANTQLVVFRRRSSPAN